MTCLPPTVPNQSIPGAIPCSQNLPFSKLPTSVLKKILKCLSTLHRQFTFLNYESVRSDLHSLYSSWKYLSHTATIFGHQNTSPEENKLQAYFCRRNTSRVRKEKFKNKVGRAFLCCFHNGLCSTPRGNRK